MIFSRKGSPLSERKIRPAQDHAAYAPDAGYPLMEMIDLSFSYPGAARPVFSRLDLSISEGDLILVQGPSGCGKSTLLRLACRLNAPSSGTIRFRGTDVTMIPPAELRTRICLVAQIPQMMDASVAGNLLLPFSFSANRSKKEPTRERLQEMLREFYLQDLTLEQSALKLSTGQKQRLALMRAILQEPDLLLLDEPTSALDKESASMIFSILERLNSQDGKTILLVTHSDYTPAGPKVRGFEFRNGNLLFQS